MSKSDDTWFEHYNHAWGKHTALEIYINLLANQLSKGSLKRAMKLVATCIKGLPADFRPEVGAEEGEKIRAGAEESLERVQKRCSTRPTQHTLGIDGYSIATKGQSRNTPSKRLDTFEFTDFLQIPRPRGGSPRPPSRIRRP